MTFRARRAGPLAVLAVTVVALAASGLAGCAPGPGELDQFRAMRAEGAAARAQETINCAARDLVCARLVQMRGEACALTANDARQSAEARARLRRCAIDDAGRMPGLMPADAPADDQARAALLVFDAWRAARDGGDPQANPAAMAAAVNSLAAMPQGQPFGQALAADNTLFDVLTRRERGPDACAELAAARQRLPATEPGTALAERVGSLRTALVSVARSCPK